MFLKPKIYRGSGAGTFSGTGDVTVTHNLGDNRGFDIECRINYGSAWEDTIPAIQYYTDYFVLNFGSADVVDGYSYEYNWSITL